MFLKWCDHCSSNYFLREILTMTMWWSAGFWSVDLAPPISRLTSALRFLSPCRQACQEPALSTSRSTLDDRTRVLQPPMIGAGSAHQWTITSPGTRRTLNQLPLNPGLPVSRCHLHVRQGLAANLTGSQPLLSDQPLSLPNTTGPMWPHRRHPENTQLWRPEEKALLRCTGLLPQHHFSKVRRRHPPAEHTEIKIAHQEKETEEYDPNEGTRKIPKRSKWSRDRQWSP